MREQESAGMELNGYGVSSEVALEGWGRFEPCRVVSYELGYPIVVCDDDGECVVPVGVDEEFARKRVDDQDMLAKIGAGYVASLHVSSEQSVSGIGVFTNEPLRKGQFVGRYMGTVFTEDEWDAFEEPDENFLFNLNDGANAVVLDGSQGPHLNHLKFLNHSCDPNVLMQEVFAHGSWHVAVVTLKDIPKGQELVHDFALHTESEEFANVQCTCGSDSCRKTLYQYHPWD